MEKQKVFWVVLAVSVFVVVVLIVGVLLLRQHPGGALRTTVTPMNDSSSQVYEYQRETPLTPPGGQPGAQTPGAQGAQPGTPGAQGAPPGAPGDQQTMHFYIGEGAPSSSGAVPGTSSTGPAPTAPAAPAPSAPAVTPPPAAAPAPAVSSTPATVRPRAARPATSTASASAAAKKVTQYWIQAGAYKSQDKAEELVKLLDGKGISSRVFSYASKSETWYRVRVGPYVNRGEAGKFLSLVKQVQGLEASYISLVPVSRASIN